MSLVFAAIVPHPPILIPQIGKNNILRLNNTVLAYKKLQKKIIDKKIDSLLIISPHGNIQQDSFSLNLSPQFICEFKEFGDFSTSIEFDGDIGLTHRIREKMETKTPLQLISEKNLDHGASVPLYMLARELMNIKIMPLNYSTLGPEAHYNFGRLLKHELVYHKERIGVIASGDLSHRLSKQAPGGYNPKAKKFDSKIINYLKKGKTEQILKLKPGLVFAAAECGYRSILILLGILEKIKNQPQLLSYEFPFGVGYLVMDFEF